jgi:thiol-disulfide isomerase/thioredoxin
MVWRVSLASMLALAITATAWGQDAAKLDLVSSGAMQRLEYYFPERIDLSKTVPSAIKKLPQNLQSPLYGVLKFGTSTGKNQFAVVLDEPSGQPAHLFLDISGSGDLSNAVPAECRPNGPMCTQSTVILPIGSADHPSNVDVCLYWFHDDPAHPGPIPAIGYYRDYARFGTITLAGQTYKAALVDEFCTGDFRGTSPPANRPGDQSGISVFVDTNGDGKFEQHPGKYFDALKPFNIHGITYELRNLTADGQFTIARSSASVPEIAPPPNLNAGQTVLSFDAQTMDGKTVHFPADYKGKIVLLDFWATWCGPCMGEVPGLVAVYQQFHGQGLDVLGITLDRPNTTGKVNAVMQQHGMVWPEIYDGKGGESRIGQLYGIMSIPHPILVDGDTGKIITSEERDLRGQALAPTIEKTLKSRSAVTKTEN